MKIVVLGLEISSKREAAFIKYNEMDVFQKINLIRERISQLYPIIQEANPDSLVLVVLKEYSIQRFDSFLNQDAEIHFSNAMKELTAKFPNLAILGGSQLVEKSYDYSEKDKVYSKLKSAYQNTAWVGAFEEGIPNNTRFWRQAHEMLKPENFENNDEKIQVTKNTACVFQNGKLIHKYNKTIPVKTDFSKNTFFNPGREKNSNLFAIRHPVTGEDIPCALEICRDHGFKVLAHKLAENAGLKVPLIHLILSDTISIDPDAIISPYTIQQDGLLNSQFIVSDRQKPEYKHVHLICISHNLFSASIDYKHIAPGFFHTPQKMDDAARTRIQALVEEKPSMYRNHEIFFALHNAICTKDTAVMEMILKYSWTGYIFNSFKSLNNELTGHTSLKEIAKRELDPETFRKFPLKNYQKIYNILKEGKEKYNTILTFMENDPGLEEFITSLPEEEVGENFREFLG